MRVWSECRCGDKFQTWTYLINSGKGKYCSKDCMYKYRKRPTGLKYNITLNSGWFESGNTPHNKGIPMADIAKSNLREKLKGRRLSVDTEFKKGDNLGEANPNWRGGVTPQNKKIRSSPEYKAWRSAVFNRDNFTCVKCGSRGGILNADHIKSFADFPELRLDIDNGRTLCISCHRKTPNYGRRRR